MTTLGPDHFGHNIRMIIKTEVAITASESTPLGHKKSKYRLMHRLTEVTE